MKYRFKTTPYVHQKAAIRRLVKQGGGALLMEPRTGKTKTVIDWLCILHQSDRIDRAIIVAPNRVMGVWQAEFATHATSPYHLTVWDADQRRRGVPSLSPSVLNVLVTSYEAFSTPGKKLPSGRYSKASGRGRVKAQLTKWIDGKPCAGVLDESHRIKSPSGKASTLLVNLAPQFTHRAILTGTPVTKADRIWDIYMQWKFLNPERFREWPTLGEFRDHFGVWKTRVSKRQQEYSEFVRPKNLAQLKSRIQEDAFILKREDCFDLPPREHIIRPVELGTETRARYDEMAEEMITIIREQAIVAPLKLVQGLRLSQLTSGFVTQDGELYRLSFEKLDALATILDDHISTDTKVVVAARYRPDLDAIESLGREMGLPTYQIRGGMDRRDSDRQVQEFRRARGANLLVMQPASASLGIDLSTAAHMVWFSLTPSWVHFTQGCDRIALSRSSTTFTYLLARKSIDEVLFNTLANDGDLAKAVMSRPQALKEGEPPKAPTSSKFGIIRS